MVYIVVLNWNQANDTLECLSSLTNVNCEKTRILVVDNGSDKRLSVAEMFPWVTLIENPTNLGFAEGNNVGIRYALEQNADYIFLLNNDARAKTETIAHLVAIMEQDPSIGILCPTITSYSNPQRHYVGAKIYWKLGLGLEIERIPEGLPSFLETDYAPGCALLIRADAIRKIGLLDSDYFAYFEDVDWSIRARHAGYRVMVVPQATVLHKGTMDCLEPKTPFATYLFWRNRFLFMRKHGHWYHQPAFAKHMARKSLELYQAAKQNNSPEQAQAFLDGYWAGLIGHYGGTRIQAPKWFSNFVQKNLNTLMSLTAWLYFFEYQKTKRERARESLS